MVGSADVRDRPPDGGRSRARTALGPALLWIGLKDSDDTVAAFDMRVELARNGEPVTSGLARCVAGLARSPVSVPVVFDPFQGGFP